MNARAPDFLMQGAADFYPEFIFQYPAVAKDGTRYVYNRDRFIGVAPNVPKRSCNQLILYFEKIRRMPFNDMFGRHHDRFHGNRTALDQPAQQSGGLIAYPFRTQLYTGHSGLQHRR